MVYQILLALAVMLSVVAAQFPPPRNPPTFPRQPAGGGNTMQTNPNFNQPLNPAAPNSPALPQQLPTPQTGGTNMNMQPGVNPGQNPGSNVNIENPDVRCATAGRAAVAQCFQGNGGFGMDVVIALLSNGSQSQLPSNHEDVRTSMCQAQSQIVTCIFNNIRSFNGTQQCSTLGSFIRLEQETIGLLNGVQQLCGTGLMPPITACMRRVNYDLAQCYREARLNPALFSAGNSRMEGAVIGDNREIAHMFCRKRAELFACQKRVLESCPRARELQILSGQDQDSSQKAMDVLCNDVDVYVSGLVCFQLPSNAVETCANQLVRDMTELTMAQIQQELPAAAFLTHYCRVRIRNLQCDAAAWSDVCEPAAVGLKREFQCNLLPAVCKNDTQLRDVYSRACAETTFARALRITSGVGAIVASVTSVLSAVVFSLLLL